MTLCSVHALKGLVSGYLESQYREPVLVPHSRGKPVLVEQREHATAVVIPKSSRRNHYSSRDSPDIRLN